MGLKINDLDKHNPPIELSTGKVLIALKGYYLDILWNDRGVTKSVLTVIRGVEIEAVP